MATVYFHPLSAPADPAELAAAGRKILENIVEREHIELAPEIPLKLHFGERGNSTYLKPGTYDGVIDFLEERKIKSFFAETSVLYGGERFSREKHTALALSHGFTRLPVVIADGARGEEAVEIPVDLRHFKTVSIASGLAKYDQILVLSHFKGHALAGFGGALKQLSMGFASKGGKMAMHLGVKPRIMGFFCKKCGACSRIMCPALVAGPDKKPVIDPEACNTCGLCINMCKFNALSKKEEA